MSESTDKLITDTRESVPRVIYRGKISITNSTAIGNSIYSGSASVTINSIAANPPRVVRSFIYDSSARELTSLPLYNNNGSDLTTPAFIEYTYHSLSSDGGKLRITFNRFATTSETKVIYFNIYSTEITSGSIL